MSLRTFITSHHNELVAMTRQKVTKRSGTRRPADLETLHGVHIFLDQLDKALVAEAKRDPEQRAEPDPPTNPDIAETAALHGRDLGGLGFSVEEVVHDYGDVCQAVTELAVQLDAKISVADFHTLNRCLDNAIAAAVSAWNSSHVAGPQPPQLASLHDQLRQLLIGTISIFALMSTGKIGATGSAGTTLGRNLTKMRALLDEELLH